MPVTGTVTHDGVTVDSNTETSDQLRTALGVAPPADSDQDASEPAESADAVAEPAQATQTADKPKPKKSLQARIDELTREKHDSRREADAAKAELTELRARLDRIERPAEKPAAPAQVQRPIDPDDPEPDHADSDRYPGGEYDPKYLREIGRWEARQELRAADRRRAEVESRSRVDVEVVRVTDAGRKAHADYDTVLEAAARQGLVYPPAAVEAILSEPFGHELAYELASDPDELRRLASLSPVRAAREVASRLMRLEAASKSGPVEKTPPVSQAKPPLKPVGGTSHVAESDPDDDASDDDWLRHERARERSRRRA